MTNELKKLKKKLGKELTIVRSKGKIVSLYEICNSTKINKNISTEISR